MANWKSNGPCSSCGSKDNLGTWDDGSSYCWGCGFHSGRTKLPSNDDGQPKVHKALPDDCSFEHNNQSIEWLAKYGLSLEDAIRWGIKCSPYRNQTIFTWPSLELWQARNHEKGRVKYFTSGNHDNTLPVYRTTDDSEVCIITEDCLSAIRTVSTGVSGGPTRHAMPLLGTTLAKSKLIALKRCYSELVFWLDSDMLDKSMRFAEQAKLLGMRANVRYSECDPKCYTNEQIQEFLK